MKTIKRLLATISISVSVWSVLIDLLTYNKLFPTDRQIVLYCIDGLAFNNMKIMLPIIAIAILEIAERIINANRVNRCGLA